jgi:hypothetical protein
LRVREGRKNIKNVQRIWTWLEKAWDEKRNLRGITSGTVASFPRPPDPFVPVFLTDPKAEGVKREGGEACRGRRKPAGN